jgi:hypothetical protein
MDPIEKHERKREAGRRLRAQRQRTGRLRGRVVAISLICFVLLWGIVFAQMATGNDPVLASKHATASTSTADKRHRAQARRAAELEAAESAAAAEAELLEAEAEVEPEPVTTSQS